MSETSRRQIRSYHRAFHFELMLYTLGNVRLWRPVPARGVFYTAVCVMAMVALAHVPAVGGATSGLGPVAVYGVIPVGLGWLLTVASVEGRRFHIAARVWARHLRSGRTLIGGYQAMKRSGSRWRPKRVLVINDGRDGSPPNGLRLDGPGRVLLRYPCSARPEGARLTVLQTSRRPADPGQVLAIAEGASVRFIGETHAATNGVAGEVGLDRSPRAPVGSGQPELGAVVAEVINDARIECGRDVGGAEDAGEERGR